jgi:hypothetical protein
MGTIVLVVGALLLVLLLFLSSRAKRAACNGLMELECEIQQAQLGLQARYSTAMPGREQYERELQACEDLAPEWRAKYEQLDQLPLLSKLTKRFRKDCKEIAFRTNLATKGLRDAAFWAQFPPGSPAAESRFKD